jgi:hypothetical protein
MKKSEIGFTIGLATILILSIFMACNLASAQTDLNLPPTDMPVRIEVFNGTQSYFRIKLMDIPAGYDVTNGTYLGWCIDTRAEMPRSPQTPYVFLYSSLNPPGELADEEWDMVNYILNHKKGEANDIQQAIWYFINLDASYTPTSQVAWQLINEAESSGVDFVPEPGQIASVICYPRYLMNPYEVQISIIEVLIPGGSPATPSPTPTPTASPSPTPTPLPKPTPTPTPSPTPSPLPTPSPSPTPTPTLTPTPTPTLSPTPTPTPTPTKTPTPTATPSPTPAPTPTPSEGGGFPMEALITLAAVIILILAAAGIYKWKKRKH